MFTAGLYACESLAKPDNHLIRGLFAECHIPVHGKFVYALIYFLKLIRIQPQ